MVDVIYLKKDESVVIDTTANIVVIANVLFATVEVYKDNNLIAVLGNDLEIFTLGYNNGTYSLINRSDWDAKLYVFRSFIF